MSNYNVVVHLTVNVKAGHIDDAEELVQRELQKVLRKTNFEVIKTEIHNATRILQQSTFETNLFGNESKESLIHRTRFELNVLDICNEKPRTLEEIVVEMEKRHLGTLDTATTVIEILAKLMRYNLIVRRNI